MPNTANPAVSAGDGNTAGQIRHMLRPKRFGHDHFRGGSGDERDIDRRAPRRDDSRPVHSGDRRPLPVDRRSKSGAPPLAVRTQQEDDLESTPPKGAGMESTYKIVELVGSSPESWEKAAEVALKEARKSLRDLRIAEVDSLDIHVDEGGEIVAYRTKLKVSFKYQGD